jgi:hypothetical protein
MQWLEAIQASADVTVRMGKLYAETTQSVICATVENPGLVSLTDFLADKQPQASATVFSGEKRFKQLIYISRSNARTLINDIQHRATGLYMQIGI